jgi:cell wall-associated NlpC family hydrolase
MLQGEARRVDTRDDMRPRRMTLRRVLVVAALAAGTAGCASATAIEPVPSPFPGAAPVASARVAGRSHPDVGALLDTALAQQGLPYRLGGDDPATGFDCSGLVQYVFLRHAIELPRTVAEQYRVGQSIGRGQVQAGDLVFFSTVGPGATHVGIALDDERFIHAPDTGAVVRIERLDTTYWRTRFRGARRVR